MQNPGRMKLAGRREGASGAGSRLEQEFERDQRTAWLHCAPEAANHAPEIAFCDKPEVTGELRRLRARERLVDTCRRNRCENISFKVTQELRFGRVS